MNTILAKVNKFVSSKLGVIVLSFIGLYLLSSGVSLVIFSTLLKSKVSYTPKTTATGGRSKINLDLPKTEVCPINGAKFTKAEKDIWDKRRPIVAMIENHADSRPPEGLSRADVIYEAVAEGGITRFMPVFYCGAAAEDVKIAPVRSARIYFINYAAEYGDKPIFMHVGGANNYCADCPGGRKPAGQIAKDAMALETLESMGWRVPRGNDFDTTYDSGYPVFWRNPDRLGHPIATEHTMIASTDSAYDQADKRGFGATNNGVKWDASFAPWKFAEDSPQTPTASDISFKFWDNKPDYDVQWKYDAGNNQYLRFTGGKEHTDIDTGKQLTAKSVVIIFAQGKPIVDKEGHALYTVIGRGPMMLFQNGQVTEGTWSKAARTSRTVFTDSAGREIQFVRGVIWLEVVPAGNKIDYQ